MYETMRRTHWENRELGVAQRLRDGANSLRGPGERKVVLALWACRQLALRGPLR